MRIRRESLASRLRAGLRSPTLWLALGMLVASIAATLVVGVELFGYTATPMIFNNR